MPEKDGTTRDAGRYVRGSSGGLGGREAGGVFTIVPYEKTEVCYYKIKFVHNRYIRRKLLEIGSLFNTEIKAVFYFELCGPK